MEDGEGVMAKKRCTTCWNHEEFCACGGDKEGGVVIPLPIRNPDPGSPADILNMIFGEAARGNEQWGAAMGEMAEMTWDDIKRLAREEGIIGEDEP